MSICYTSGKNKIRSKKEAEKLLFNLKIKRGLKNQSKVEVRYYKCPSCHYLHLTSKQKQSNKGENKMVTNENGFSLVELAVSMAIYITLSAIAVVNLVPVYTNIVDKIEEAKAIQAANPEAQYIVTFGN